MKPMNINLKRYNKRDINQAALLILLMVQVLVSLSCKKLVEVDAPMTSLTAKNVYTNDATAAAVLTGIYAQMGNAGVYSGSRGIGLRMGLCADELTLSTAGYDNGIRQQFYENNFSAQNSTEYWLQYYNVLLTVNSAIEGLQRSTGLTPTLKDQLEGEAKFLRAFFHFYLVNIYGNVLLSTTSDWRINSSLARSSKAIVYQQIISDLKDAQTLLSDKYLQADALTAYTAGTEERVRPTKWAAAAFLARVYLFYGNLTGDPNSYTNAETQASSVINNPKYSLNALDAAFTKNNKEAIWQIQYVISGSGTEGFHFILTSSPSISRPAYLSSFLLNAFEPGDDRKNKWVKSFSNSTGTWYHPFKYKVQSNPNNSEYFMVLRLAEQYLIRAEARAKQNNLSGAIADIDIIRQRASLPLIVNTNPSISQTALLTAILHERQVELFTEWGHRWFDLKRTETIDAIMSAVLPVKRPGFTWNTNWQLLPIPFSEIQLNPNLAPNNPGY